MQDMTATTRVVMFTWWQRFFLLSPFLIVLPAIGLAFENRTLAFFGGVVSFALVSGFATISRDVVNISGTVGHLESLLGKDIRIHYGMNGSRLQPGSSFPVHIESNGVRQEALLKREEDQVTLFTDS